MLPLLLLSIVDLQSCTSFIYIYTHTAQWVSDIYAYIPGSSADKESACDAGDPSLIPESGRCPGKGIGYPFQYSWASLVAQTVKNLPAMREAWVWFLGPGISLGGGLGKLLQYSCLENPHGRKSLAGPSPWDQKELDTTEQLSIAQHI